MESTFLSGLTALAVCLAVLPASALGSVTYTVTYLGDPAVAEADTVDLTVFGPGIAPDGRAGPTGPVWLSISGSDDSIRSVLAYSIDAERMFAPGSRYTLVPLDASPLDPTKRAQIAALLASGAASARDPIADAALQTSIWEVEYEAGCTGYGIGTGAFQVSAYGGWLDPRVVKAAREDLAELSSGGWREQAAIGAWQLQSTNGSSESFAVAAFDGNSQGIPIPEPSSIALTAAAALAVIGVRLRPRNGGPEVQPDPTSAQTAISAAAMNTTVR